MGIERHDVRAAREAWADEIDQAIDNVNRAKLDKWMTREWHQAGA